MENLDVFVLALFCFLMGAGLVGLIVYSRGSASKRASSSNTPDPDLEEVAQLWRSRKANRIVVQLGENHYAAASELSPEQQRYLARAASALQAWLAEGEPVKVPPPPAAPYPGASMPPMAPREQDIPLPASPAQEVKPVPARPLDALNRAFTSSPAKAAPKYKSIAAQINDILQAHLPGSPFEAQGISLVEKPDQSVVVRVGSEEYPGVDAVPDPAVRALIKAAVTEWEIKIRGTIQQ